MTSHRRLTTSRPVKVDHINLQAQPHNVTPTTHHQPSSESTRVNGQASNHQAKTDERGGHQYAFGSAGSLQRPSDTRIRSWLTTATILSMIDSVTEDTDYKIRVVPIRPITARRAGRTVRQ